MSGYRLVVLQEEWSIEKSCAYNEDKENLSRKNIKRIIHFGMIQNVK